MRKTVCSCLMFVCVLAHAAPSDSTPDNAVVVQEDQGVLEKVGAHLKQGRDALSGRASDLVGHAMGFLGVPYRYGGTSLETGVDCSGFVRAVFEQSVGKLLPRRASEQAAVTESITRDELKPGDLVFFNTMKRAFSHVGIYLGEGKFIHAPRSGGSVRVEDMRMAYWQARFNGARRVNNPQRDAVPPLQ
jgi:cell wall-associated NlpC family hydrolase